MEPLTYRLLAKAKREIDEAVEHYENRLLGLGEAFADEVAHTLERICRHPTTGSHISQSVRVCATHRFPYGIVFQVRADHALVVAVHHLHRDLEYWKDRVKDI